ncbi:MAG: YkgJ family cysteine cluster protein, partial [Bdellovibrionales bacterium]|nr:YkgJ family cysteine cluster protein [Bdellovibrionales bacterium]
GDCYFLEAKTRRCTVYEKRPQVCRFFPERMGPKLGFCPQISLGGKRQDGKSAGHG